MYRGLNFLNFSRQVLIRKSIFFQVPNFQSSQSELHKGLEILTFPHSGVISKAKNLHQNPGALNTMRCVMCHQKDAHFLSPLSPNDSLVYALPPIDPYLLSKIPNF